MNQKSNAVGSQILQLEVNLFIWSKLGQHISQVIKRRILAPTWAHPLMCFIDLINTALVPAYNCVSVAIPVELRGWFLGNPIFPMNQASGWTDSTNKTTGSQETGSWLDKMGGLGSPHTDEIIKGSNRICSKKSTSKIDCDQQKLFLPYWQDSWIEPSDPH
jgi:hypothetical protein